MSFVKHIGFMLVASIALLGAGCAYYNTFYNAKKTFAEAEKDQRRQETQQQQQQAQGTAQHGSQSPPALSADKYHKVIETCAKLLEFYPKSRWVDDAIYLMGLSYYRLSDWPRAERKFTELVTIFPQSKYAAEASIYRAKTLVQQKQKETAVEALNDGLTKAHSSTHKASIYALLGEINSDERQWNDAADHLSKSLELRSSGPDALLVLYKLGLAEFELGKYIEARNAFARVARSVRDWDMAYDAFVHWSKAESRLGNFEVADGLLRRAAVNPRFISHAEDVPLELGDLTLESGRIDDAVNVFRDYLVTHREGTKRGRAYFRLAVIYRDNLKDLTLSKSYLDSTVQTGGASVYADSARSMLSQVSKGLEALQRIHDITEQLKIPDEVPATPSPLSADSQNVMPLIEDTLKSDSLLPESPVHRSAAAAAADSILQSILHADTIRQLPVDTVKAAEVDSTSQAPPAVAANEASATDRKTLMRELHIAYIHAAEFYRYGLVEADSALYYYRLAASMTDDPAAHWKANLYLGQYILQNDTARSDEARMHFQTVLDADSVPLDAANMARSALGIPIVEPPIPPQSIALQNAEEIYLMRSASWDSLLSLYSAVIAMDSSTPEGQTALFAKAHIYENELLLYDSARTIYEVMLARHPDSSYASILRHKLAPPDSGSYFLMSDQELLGLRAPVEDILEEKADAAGWPPPEESLQGRRFH